MSTKSHSKTSQTTWGHQKSKTPNCPSCLSSLTRPSQTLDHHHHQTQILLYFNTSSTTTTSIDNNNTTTTTHCHTTTLSFSSIIIPVVNCPCVFKTLLIYTTHIIGLERHQVARVRYIRYINRYISWTSWNATDHIVSYDKTLPPVHFPSNQPP